MEKAYESLCLELDRLLIEIQKYSQKHIESKLEVEKWMNEGFFNLAKARYINGSATVSMMQLPTEFSKPLEPLATVIEEEKEGEKIRRVSRRSYIVRQSVDSSDDGMRQRKGKSTDLDMKELKDEALPDPIKLFGVLVPQALKDAQKNFIKAVDGAAVSANIHCKLQASMDRYTELMEKKVLLTEKSEAKK